MLIWNNLRTKLLVVFLSLLLVPVTGMGIYSYLFMSRTVLDKAIEVEQQNLDSQASHVRSILVETQNTLIFLSNLQAMQVLRNTGPETDLYQSSLQVLARDLQNYLKMFPIVQYLAYYDQLGAQAIEVATHESQQLTPDIRNFITQVLSSPIDTTHLFLDTPAFNPYQDLTLALRVEHGVIVIMIRGEALFQPGINNVVSETWSLQLPVQKTLHVIGTQQPFLPSQANEYDNWRRNTRGYYRHNELYTFYQNISIPTSRSQYNVVLFHTILANHLQPDLNQYAQAFVTLSIGILFCVLALGLFAIDRFITPLRHLKELVDEIRRTEKTPMLPHRLPPDEIGELSLAFYTMAIELEAKRISERALVEKLITAQEDERKRIAYDLHDGLIQQLVGARFYVNQANSQVQPEVSEILTVGIDTLSSAIVEGRRIMQGLHPSVLDDLGINEALKELSLTIAKVAKWQLELDIQELRQEVDRLTSVTLYRVVQEALNNALKHAEAQNVSVTLSEDEMIHLIIADDGHGFDNSSHNDSKGWGLRTMRERVTLLHGTFQVDSQIGTGTIIHITLPPHKSEMELTKDD